jgi:hypothetical protein
MDSLVRRVAPPLIVSVVVILFFGGKGAIFVLVGIAMIVGVIAVGVQHRRSVCFRLYSSDPNDWMSRAAIFVGPFDNSGVPDAAAFARRHTASGDYPEIRLLVTKNGLAFGPGIQGLP